jgi:hypothetical protein
VSRLHRAAAGLFLVLLVLTPALAAGQAAQQAPAPPDSSGQALTSRTWIVLGASATTLRGTCQFCELETGYRHTWSLLADVGVRINPRADVGVEVLWVPASSEAGDDIRTTYIAAVGQFRPWSSKWFFLKGGAGMAIVRNFVFDLESPALQKALAIHFGGGWEFRRDKRVGFEVFGAQHAAALGDFVLREGTVDNVMGNYWSLGAALVIR